MYTILAAKTYDIQSNWTPGSDYSGLSSPLKTEAAPVDWLVGLPLFPPRAQRK